jgi:hypothetical protein
MPQKKSEALIFRSASLYLFQYYVLIILNYVTNYAYFGASGVAGVFGVSVVLEAS